MSRADMLRAQAFQNAICNWRCWYCFVPFDLLSANSKFSAWLSPADLLALYLDQPDPPPMIDLTGEQPDLVPERVVWMMEAIKKRGLEQKIYLWSDDSLSNDYFWQFLSEHEREWVATYPNYERVCCFKGFSEESFAFNTLAAPELFDRQFELMERFIATGMDIYGYTTFTAPRANGIKDYMRRFVDRLQQLDENLPLRTIPLEIRIFGPVEHRLNEVKRAALTHQQTAIEAWQRELTDRFSSTQRAAAEEDISAIALRSQKKHY